MLNTCSIMGRLTADPELRYTQSNIAVTAFALAVDRDYAKDGERETDFLGVVAWRQTAEFVAKYFRKGQLVAVTGRLQTRKYTDKQGSTRTVTEIIADQVYFAEKKREEPTTATKPRQVDFEEIEGDDLPF